MVLYPITAGFFVTISLAGFLNNIRTQTTSVPRFGSTANSLFELFAWFMMGSVLLTEFTQLGPRKSIQLKLSGL